MARSIKSIKSASSSSFTVVGLDALHQAVTDRLASIDAGAASAAKLTDRLMAVVVSNLGGDFVTYGEDEKPSGLTPAGQTIRAAILAEKARLDAVGKAAKGDASLFSHAWKILVAPLATAKGRKTTSIQTWSKALGVTAPVRLDDGKVPPKALKAPKAPKAPDLAGTDDKAPSVPVVKNVAANPVLALANDLVALRKIAAGKKKQKLILAALGEIEDLLDDVKTMLAA